MSFRRRGKKGIYSAIIWKDGKQRWKSLRTVDLKLAKKRYGDLLAEKAKPEKKLWINFCKEYLEYSKTEHGRRTYERDKVIIGNFNQRMPVKYIGEFGVKILKDYKVKRINEGKQPSTINRELNTLIAMGHRAMEWKYIEYTDLRPVKKLKVTRRITHFFGLDAVERIKGAEDTLEGKIRIFLPLYTGFRRGECLMLRWQDIDFENNLIQLRSHRDHSIKDYQEAKIQLHPELKKVLQEYQPQSRSEYVLGELNEDAYTKWWGRRLKRLNIEGTLHIARHTVGTVIANKLGIEKAKELLRHKSVRTTERYNHQRSELVEVGALPY